MALTTVSQVTTGSTSTVTLTQATPPAGVTGWRLYGSSASGGPYYIVSGATPIAIGTTTYTVTSPIPSSGAVPPVGSTITGGGFIAVDGTNMPGWYEVSIPNTALASGDASVGFQMQGATNMENIPWQYELDAVNYQDGIHFGMTALPNAAAAAAGGLPTIGTGAGQINVDGAGNASANVVKVAG